MRKTNKGITLIALIITVVVLLVLAIVTIRAVQGDGIISHAKEAKSKYEIAQEKEKITLALNQAYLDGNGEITKENLSNALKAQFGEDYIDDETSDEFIQVDLGEVRRAYKVYLNRQIIEETLDVENPGGTPSTGGETEIVINSSKIVLSADGTGEEITAQSIEYLTTKLYISISASIDGGTIISVKQGETEVTKVGDIYVYEVEAGKNASYEFTITASTGKTKTITKEVTQYVIPIDIGTNVEYDVSYIDMYAGIEYTKTTGWRYLGKDDDGNKLLISTAIPAILWYYYNPDTLPTWWATNDQITAEDTPAEYKTTAGWVYDDNGEPNKYAAYGLRYKFRQIPFSYKEPETSVSISNTGIFRKVGDTTGEGTTLSENSFIDSRYVSKIINVHNLTQEELKKGNNNSTSGFKDLDGTAKGLFDMSDLENYTVNWYYWLASRFSGGRNNVCFVNSYQSYLLNNDNTSLGVRPVITLSSDVVLEDKFLPDGTPGQDGILEIY